MQNTCISHSSKDFSLVQVICINSSLCDILPEMQKRFSQKREDIRQYLSATHGAVSAAAIQNALPHIDLTTVYRNLDQFVAEGDVKKITLGGEALFEYQPHPHHHAVCDECHEVIHFTAPDEKIKQLLGLTNFMPSSFEITVHGLCRYHVEHK